MGSGTASGLLACTACGVGLPSGSKFCFECGTPVTGAVERETRRTVTLVFTDMTGSTAMGEQLDPEAYRGVMGRYFEVARSAVERHGGTVEKFVGDAVLAVFGIPEVHEDDALRAVRAARDLNDGIAALSEQLVADLGLGLVIRTGVNTGAVVAGAARAGGSFATGDAVNTAARLEQAAAPGEILLGAATYALVRDAVEVEDPRSVSAKGKAEPVPAYRLLRVLDADLGRTRRGGLALIGRVTENRTLEEAFALTAASGASRQVTVIGPAGIGKSRLIGDFLARIDDGARVANGRCLSYGQGITYWPLAQALRGALRLSGTESPEITRHALTEALGGATDRDRLVEPLMALMGKGGPPAGSEQTFWCVRRLVEELASQRPLVLSLDDLHWAEPDLLELLARMRSELKDLPLLLLCQARPELLEEHPDWDADVAGSTTVRLAPLSLAETSASVAALLDGVPPAGLASTVSDWSGGNPLFIEEIVAHLVESGVLEREQEGRWLVTRPLDRAEPPPTVTALLTSRLDRLPAPERDLLERASVIGLEFAATEVAGLVAPHSRPPVADLLSALTRRDLVRPGGGGAQDLWAFKHVLVRDAAYDGMAKSLRSELHERFADALAQGDDRDDGGDERCGFVAHHLEQAARYRRELAGRDQETEALVERAVEALILAADRARGREREDTAVSYLGRALALRPSDARTRREILARRLASSYEAGLMDLLDEALREFGAELEGVAGGVDRLYLEAMRGLHALSTGGDIDPVAVSVSARELVALGRATDHVPSIVRGLRVQSICSALRARWIEAEDLSVEVTRIGSRADARLARYLHLVALCLGAATLREWREQIRNEAALDQGGGSVADQLFDLLSDAVVAAAECSPEAHAIISEAAALNEQLYAAGALSQPTMPLLAETYRMALDLDGAIDYFQRVNDGFRRTGDLGHASTYILMQSLLMLERGDPDDAVAVLTDEAASYTSPFDAISMANLAACRAILAARAGDLDRSNQLAVESLRHADATDELWHRADLRRALGSAARLNSDAAYERRLLTEAAEMYARKEIRSYDAEINARLAELGTGEP